MWVQTIRGAILGMATTLVDLWTIDALEKHHAKCHIGSSTGFIPMGNIFVTSSMHQELSYKTAATVLLPAKSIAKLGKKIAAAHMFHEFQYSKITLATNVLLKVKLLNMKKNMCVHGASQHILILTAAFALEENHFHNEAE
jgi:hypothetical protein